MSKDKKYSQVKKEYRKIRRRKILDKINIFVRFYRWRGRIKEQYVLNNNLAPDISTVTENIAFVIDDEVVEIIHCQPKMAAILTSEPLIIPIESGIIVKPGYKYINGEFKKPEENK
jgi:hypothetical protein